MTRADIKEKVLAKLDELETHSGASQSPSDALIEALMDGSTESMLRHAPIHLLIPTKVNPLGASFVHVKNLTKGTGHIALPFDFLRLYSFKMNAWHRPATDFISISNPLYKLQQNESSRGGVIKPVVAINYFDTTAGSDVSGDLTEQAGIE